MIQSKLKAFGRLELLGEVWDIEFYRALKRFMVLGPELHSFKLFETESSISRFYNYKLQN